MFKNCLCGRNLEAKMPCGSCNELFCKKCIEFLPDGTFEYMKVLPVGVTTNQYCLGCYASKIRPEVINYGEIMKRAKEVLIIDKPVRRPLPILRKSKEALNVEGCLEREEAVLRLAFRAAELGFNSVIKANISHKRVGNEGYLKMAWQGTGLAAELDDRKLD